MQIQKTQMAKRQFRIGDLAKELKVKKFVIRFWEKEFDLKSGRSQGGQRFYTNDDLAIFLTIKDLLYNQGFTIAGAKKQLPEVLAGAKLAPNDSFQDLDELPQEFSSHAVQTDDDQEAHDCELEDEQDGEPDQEFVLHTQSDSQVVSEEQIISKEIVQETATVQAAQEICFPARALPDDSFYDGLAALKEQLLRLHELLD